MSNITPTVPAANPRIGLGSAVELRVTGRRRTGIVADLLAADLGPASDKLNRPATVADVVLDDAQAGEAIQVRVEIRRLTAIHSAYRDGQRHVGSEVSAASLTARGSRKPKS